MNILIFGHVCIDRNKPECSEYTSWGSPAMFMKKAFKDLDVKDITIVSNYGKDYLKYLKDINIYPLRPNTETTMIYQNLVNNHKRKQRAFTRNSEPVEISEELKVKISEAGIIIVAPILSNYKADYIDEIFKYAKSDSLKVLLPQGYFRNFDEESYVIFREFKEVNTVLKYFDLMSLSEEDYPNIEELSEKWVGDFNVNIVVTKGENGAVIIQKGGKKKVSTIPVPKEEIVDSTGSGEIFSAALIYSYFQTRNLEKATHFANEVASKALRSTHAKI